jgi:hypothetical protein
VYADMRLTYPNTSRQEIHNMIIRRIKANKSDLYEFITNYLNTVATVKTQILNATSSEEIDNIILELIRKEKKTARKRRNRQRKSQHKSRIK